MDVKPAKPVSIEAYRELNPATPDSLAMRHVSRATELLDAARGSMSLNSRALEYQSLAQEHRALASLLFGLQR